MTDPKGRYLLFAIEQYYPAGGWGDLVDRLDSLDDALAEAEKIEARGESANVIDIETNEQCYMNGIA